MRIPQVLGRVGSIAVVCMIAMMLPLKAPLLAQELRRGAVSRAVLDLSIPPSDDPAWDLSFVRDMTVDPRGRMYVLENSDQTVRVYDATGKPVRKLGRKGEGPGEFTYAGQLLIRGDTIVVIEAPLNRVTWFAPGSATARTIRLRPKLAGGSSIVSLMPGGYVVATGSAVGQWAGGPGGSAAYVAVDSGGNVGATILSARAVPRPLVMISYRQGDRSSKASARGYGPQPLARPTFAVISPDGATILSVEEKGTQGLFGRCTLLLTARDGAGRVRWSRDLACDPLPFTDADFTSLIDSLAKPVRLKNVVYVKDRKMLAESLYRTATWPVVTGFEFGVDGTIWLKQGGPPTNGDRYWRLSPTGVLETSVQLPPGFVLKAASRSKVWGWRLDADGVPIIERYRY